MARRGAFEQTRFALCEGNEDAALVRELVAAKGRRIQPFDVSPVNDLSQSKGNGGFRDAIIASDAMTNFEKIREVIIVADNDDDPDASFEFVRSQLQKAKDDGDVQQDWAVPDEPGVRAAGEPSVMIWMWPAVGKMGCLETVLWDVILKKYKDHALCVDRALACTGADTWATSKRDKARIRCFMSLTHKRNPALALSLVWRDAPSVFPASSAEFTPLAKVLASM